MTTRDFLDRKKILDITIGNGDIKTVDFISKAIDEGFRITTKPNQHKTNEVDLRFMSEEKKKIVLENEKNMPDFVLVHPEKNSILELFQKGDVLEHASMLYKFSIPASKSYLENELDNFFMVQTVNEKFENGRQFFVKHASLNTFEELDNFTQMYKNNLLIQEEKLSFNPNELNFLSFMTNNTASPALMQGTLSKVLDRYNHEVVNYGFFKPTSAQKVKVS